MTSLHNAATPWPLPDLAEFIAGIDDDAEPAESLAWDRGWEEGLAAGAERAAAAEASVRTLKRAADAAVEAAIAALRHEVDHALPALALAIARVLVEREIAADPAVMQHLVGRALAIVPLRGTVDVRLNPDDLATLNAGNDLASAPGELRWLADATLLRGSCMVEGPSSIVDGRIDRVLLDLYDRLTRE